MLLRKYKYLIVVAFMGIFLAKMVISAAPVFFQSMDSEIINSVIMQIEVEHGSEKDTSKASVKFTEFKTFELPYGISYEIYLSHFGLNNNFIDHFRRYVDPFHPSVPTPPPNCA